MKRAHAMFSCFAVLFAGIASPAAAGDYALKAAAFESDAGLAVHAAIYDATNLIARLEANPRTDDGYRAPIIERARSDIRKLHTLLPSAQWRWTNPCCYSRRPIYIR
jgi:hypothetical protein